MMLQLALFGEHIQYSLSPLIHRQFAQHLDVRLDYRLMDVSRDEFPAALVRFRDQGGHGANITVPFKRKVLELTTGLTQVAAQVGAVNTLIFRDEQILGANTDVQGSAEHLMSLGWRPDDRTLVWGCGGAARAVLAALKRMQAVWVGVACRDDNQARLLASASGASVVAVPWDARQETTVDWIINATSVSPAMDWFPAAPARGYCDLRYGSQCTEALQAARARGLAVVSDGLGMLVRQAAGSFELWTGVKPDRALVERVLSLCSRG